MSNKVRPVRPLGQAAEDCLEAIHELGRGSAPARVRDLARRLGVSAPTVVSAVAALERRGRVDHEPYGGVELTPAGRARAEDVRGRHELLREFLQDVLGVSESTAARDACGLEHALSAETAAKLVRFVSARDGGRWSRGPADAEDRTGRVRR
jgi:Mn-dependent DtxR family transcriptional regulator